MKMTDKDALRKKHATEEMLTPAARQLPKARALIFGAKRHSRETIRHPCTFTCTTVATNTRNFAALVIDRAFPDSLSFLLPPATKTHIPVFTPPNLV